MGGESFLQLSGGFLLPTVSRLVGFGVLEIRKDNSVQDGTTKPAVVTESCTDELPGSTERCPSSKCLIINSAMRGCLPLTTRKHLPNWQNGPLPSPSAHS